MSRVLQPHDLHARLLEGAAGPHWQRIGICHHHGIAIPLFSLWSERSGGIGEYPDLIPLLDWCRTQGFDTLQLLPLNDTGEDPSPYSSLSAFGLNPLYLALDQLPFPIPEAELAELRTLTQKPRVDYRNVRSLKAKLLDTYLPLDLAKEREFLAFQEESPWLRDYTLFHILLEEHRAPWRDWPLADREPTPSHLEQLEQIHSKAITKLALLQYCCDQQLRKVKAYADRHHLFLFGDLPILIGFNSCDVWRNPHLFDLTASAGAPPDYYSRTGQHWSVPLYRWEEMAAEGYQWWKMRLTQFERYFHLYRLDHVVGFYRIWTIPEGAPALQGVYHPSDRQEQLDQGERIMRMMLDHSFLLPIGEDLGKVPDRVKRSLTSLGICGTRVLRWQHRYGHYLSGEHYPPTSVTTLGTHDTTPFALWWRTERKESRRLCHFLGVGQWGRKIRPDQLKEALRFSHQTGSLFHINPLNDYLSTDPSLIHKDLQLERINTPGTVSPNNWTYRLIPSLEQLQELSLDWLDLPPNLLDKKPSLSTN